MPYVVQHVVCSVAQGAGDVQVRHDAYLTLPQEPNLCTLATGAFANNNHSVDVAYIELQWFSLSGILGVVH